LQLLFSFLDEEGAAIIRGDTAVFLLFLLDMEATNVYTARRTLKIISLDRGIHIQNQLVA
jgi:hypothetical protein